jgi:membrane associated rhomboid family serine protease
MSSSDLFVVCMSCGSEVSPYVTECPYCGTRLRKRAPKIERGGASASSKPPSSPRSARPPRASRPSRPPSGGSPPSPRLRRLRSREVPGIGADETRRPWATIVLVALSFGIWLSLAFLLRADLALTSLSGDPWRYLTAPLVNVSGWGQFAAVVGIGVFGWLLERRHGPVVVVAIFFLAGSGGLLVAEAIAPVGLTYGSHGAALGLLCAWGVGALLARRRGDEEDDLLGATVLGVVLLLMPLATDTSVLAGVVGALIGALAGLPLAALRRR